MVDETIQNQNADSAATAQETEQAAQAVGETQPEKVLKQSVVNEIVGSAKRDAYEKGKREVYGEWQNQTPVATPAPAQKAIAEQQTFSAEDVRKIVAEETQIESTRKVAEEIAYSFSNKMQAGYAKYPDFDEKVGKLNIPAIPAIVHFANKMDNTADVMYELASHPIKFANVLALAKEAPELAEAAFNDLSSSIKKNQEAKAKEQGTNVQAPLDQIKPSTTGTDNGSLSVADLRNQDYLRG